MLYKQLVFFIVIWSDWMCVIFMVTVPTENHYEKTETKWQATAETAVETHTHTHTQRDKQANSSVKERMCVCVCVCVCVYMSQLERKKEIAGVV